MLPLSGLRTGISIREASDRWVYKHRHGYHPTQPLSRASRANSRHHGSALHATVENCRGAGAVVNARFALISDTAIISVVRGMRTTTRLTCAGIVGRVEAIGVAITNGITIECRINAVARWHQWHQHAHQHNSTEPREHLHHRSLFLFETQNSCASQAHRR